MPKLEEIGEIVVNGQRYRDWESVSVTRSGMDVYSRFTFTAASAIESAPNFAGLKLRIGDACQIYLAGQLALSGKIRTRQPAYDDKQHGLQLGGRSEASVIGRATVDHEKGEFKGFNLEQIVNALIKPHNIKFYLKGDTAGADKVFEKFNVQAGETKFDAIERLCRMRNIYLFDDKEGNLVGYRLGAGVHSFADLQEGRNIKAASAIFDHEGAFSEVGVTLQRQGNNDHHGDDARDVSAKVTNPAATTFAPLYLMGEMPGDQRDAQMRAQHENGENLAQLINIQVTVHGWQHEQGKLWLDKLGELVTLYSPLILPDDRDTFAIQEATCLQSNNGTTSIIGLVHRDRYNGGGQVGATSTPFIPGAYGGAR